MKRFVSVLLVCLSLLFVAASTASAFYPGEIVWVYDPQHNYIGFGRIERIVHVNGRTILLVNRYYFNPNSRIPWYEEPPGNCYERGN